MSMSSKQRAAESDVEGFRRDLGPFVVAAETTRSSMPAPNDDAASRPSSSTPSVGDALRNPRQGLGPAEKRHSHVDARDEQVGGPKLGGDAVRVAVVRIVEPAVLPPVRTCRMQPIKDGQAA